MAGCIFNSNQTALTGDEMKTVSSLQRFSLESLCLIVLPGSPPGPPHPCPDPVGVEEMLEVMKTTTEP